jgi:two-component system NarL family sensor kinase
MPKNASLAEAFLEQSPACSWIVSAESEFQSVFGDSIPVFGKAAAELVGRRVAQALDAEAASVWSGRIARAIAGETLLLRERRGNAAWHITLFPIRREGGPTLAGGMAREVTRWNKAEHELRNTVLSALRAQEFERNMFSKFLHDSVGQNLTGLGMQLDLARMDVEAISPEACRRIAEIQKILEPIMEQVREYTYELNPSVVERAGLRSALDRLASRTRERYTGAFRVNVDPFLKIDPKIASALYQIAQEAVGNAVQHASCSSIEIAVKSTRTGLAMDVRDNGRGFDPADVLEGIRGLGLLSMEHFAAQAGLDLSVTSHRGAGTTIQATALRDE